MFHVRKWGAALLAALLAMNLAACSQAEEAAVQPRALVDVAAPVVGDIAVAGEFIGTVEPDQQLTIYPMASGEILSVNVKVGDVVEAGQVLVQLDSEITRLQIAQTQAAINAGQARANLSIEIAEKRLDNTKANVKEGTDAATMQAENAVKSAENGVERAQLALSTARKNLRELRNMDDYEYETELQMSMGYITYDRAEETLKNAVAQAENALEAAQLGLQQAKAGLEAAQSQTAQGLDVADDEIELAKLQADLTEAKIGLQLQQKALEYYTVTASIGGVVEQVNVSAHDMAAPQVPLLVISNKDVMTVSFNVSDASLSHMRTGDRVTMEKDGVSFPGVISEISTMVDARSGLYPVKAVVENPPVELHTGSAIKVFADMQKAENQILIPIDALYYESGRPFVYLAEGGKAVKTYVETGISDDTMIQIVSGLRTGDRFVSTWNSNLADGADIALPGEEAVESSAPQPEAQSTEDRGESTDIGEDADSEEDAGGEVDTEVSLVEED